MVQSNLELSVSFTKWSLTKIQLAITPFSAVEFRQQLALSNIPGDGLSLAVN